MLRKIRYLTPILLVMLSSAVAMIGLQVSSVQDENRISGQAGSALKMSGILLGLERTFRRSHDVVRSAIANGPGGDSLDGATVSGALASVGFQADRIAGLDLNSVASEALISELDRWSGDVSALLEVDGPAAVSLLPGYDAYLESVTTLTDALQAEVRREMTIVTNPADKLLPLLLALIGLCGAGLVARATAALGEARDAREIDALPGIVREIAAGDAQPHGQRTSDNPLSVARAELERFAAHVRSEIEERDTYERMALTDPLTGLPNRRGLFSLLDGVDENGLSDISEGVGILHIDLDHFKSINDTLGHAAGDFALQEATRRMAAAVRDTDVLCRLGGDEFVVIAPGVTNSVDLCGIAERLIEKFETPAHFEEHRLALGASVGIALGGTEGTDPDLRRLLIYADIALGKAKTAGRNRYAFFGTEMASQVSRKEELSAAIRRGLENEAFGAQFQPVVSLPDNAVRALEVTPRWQGEATAELTTTVLLAEAEVCRSAEAIGVAMLQNTVDECRRVLDSGGVLPPLHIPMTRSQLLSARLHDQISWSADSLNVSPADLSVGIPEAILSERGSGAVLSAAQRYKSAGFGIFIAGFGQDSAALGHVVRSGSVAMKLDPGLIADLSLEQHTDRVHRIVSGIAAFATEIGLTIAATGVHDAASLDAIAQVPGVLAQGDAIRPPLDAAGLHAFLMPGEAIDHTMSQSA